MVQVAQEWLNIQKETLTAAPGSLCLVAYGKMGTNFVLENFSPVLFTDSEAECQKLLPLSLTSLLT